MRLSTDRIVSLSAMAVGVSSLFIILYQTHLMRQEQRASALPYLMFAIDANEAGIHLTLTNAGLGPALIEDVRVVHSDREFEGDPHDYYRSLNPTSDSALSINKVMLGRLLPAGSSLRLLGLDATRAQGTRGGQFLAELLHHFEVAEVSRSWYENVGAANVSKAVVHITYKSVYGERWRIRSDKLVPDKL